MCVCVYVCMCVYKFPLHISYCTHACTHVHAHHTHTHQICNQIYCMDNIHLHAYETMFFTLQNGYWFGMGWGIIFLLPTMISAIILTIYLRRSRTAIEVDRYMCLVHNTHNTPHINACIFSCPQSMEVYENTHVNMERFEM